MRVCRALGAALVLAGLLLVATSTATAQQGLPPLVTDFSTYPDTPQALLTDGCDFTGLTGASFSLNGSPPVDSVSALPDLQAGDTMVMAWSGVAPACVGSAVSLVVKNTPQPFFDPAVDQPTAPGGYNVATLTDGAGSVSLVLPDLFPLGNSCSYQVDAIVGVPLAVVGPGGSFYSESLRGDGRRTTLVSFRNGAYSICAAQTTSSTTSTTTTTTTTTAPPPPTTQPPAPPTTQPPAPPTSTTPPAPTSTVATATLAAQSAVQAAQAQRTLAATGTTSSTALVGVIVVGFGLLLLVASSRRQAATPPRSS